MGSTKTIEYTTDCYYSKFRALKELTKLECFERKDGTKRYEKMIQTGQCDDFFDYNTGFLCVCITVNKNHSTDDYFVQISFNTIHDGDYGGWTPGMDYEKAQSLADIIATEVFDEMYQLPTLEELNETLRTYGLYVGRY